MPPLRMHRDHHLVRQGPLTGQVRQVGRAVHPDVKPGRHPVPDAGAGMVPASAGIGEVIYPLPLSSTKMAGVPTQAASEAMVALSPYSRSA